MEIIENLTGRTDKTLIGYKYKYEFMVKSGINYLDPEENIINKLKKLDVLYTRLLDTITIIIVLRNESGLSNDKLRIYRNTIIKPDPELEKNKIQNMPSLSDIDNYINQLYGEDKYKEFIINFLIRYMNTRNQDLNLLITRNNPDDKTRNYLIINPDKSITYIRNVYKTAHKYGRKEHVIKSDAFYDACVNYEGKELLTTTNFNQEIKFATLNKIGSGRYFKVIVSNARPNEIVGLSKQRGTNPNTVLEYYVQ